MEQPQFRIELPKEMITIINSLSEQLRAIQSALLLNAWYSSQHVHFARRGALTDETRMDLLTSVLQQNSRFFRLLNEIRSAPDEEQTEQMVRTGLAEICQL